MYSRLLRDRLLAVAIWNRRCGRNTSDTAAVPDTADVVARNNLCKTTCFDVSDLDEAAVEQEDVGRMPCDMLCCAFPLDGSNRAAGISVAINVEAKLCR